MLRILFLCAALVAPSFVAANDGAIDEVLVTATRRPASSEEISAALTLVGREQAERQKLVSDALADSVGVFLQNTGRHAIGDGAFYRVANDVCLVFAQREQQHLAGLHDGGQADGDRLRGYIFFREEIAGCGSAGDRGTPGSGPGCK